MTKRYLIATLIGTCIGLGLICLYAFDYSWNETSWYVPYVQLDVPNAKVEQLREQALLLRACHLILQDGLSFLGIPILGCIALAKFAPSANSGIHSSVFSRRITWCYLVLCFAILCLGCLHLVSSDLRSLFDDNLGRAFMFSVLGICALSVIGFLPGIAMIGALVLEWHERCNDIPEIVARELAEVRVAEVAESGTRGF